MCYGKNTIPSNFVTSSPLNKLLICIDTRDSIQQVEGTKENARGVKIFLADHVPDNIAIWHSKGYRMDHHHMGPICVNPYRY